MYILFSESLLSIYNFCISIEEIKTTKIVLLALASHTVYTLNVPSHTVYTLNVPSHTVYTLNVPSHTVYTLNVPRSLIRKLYTYFIQNKCNQYFIAKTYKEDMPYK